MIVCCCMGVSDRTIRDLVAAGVQSVDELASTCGAGADCGACGPLVQSLVEEAEPAMYLARHGSSHHTDAGGVTCAGTIRSSLS